MKNLAINLLCLLAPFIILLAFKIKAFSGKPIAFVGFGGVILSLSTIFFAYFFDIPWELSISPRSADQVVEIGMILSPVFFVITCVSLFYYKFKEKNKN